MTWAVFGWGVFTTEDEVHVAPVDELDRPLGHIVTDYCPCEPRIEYWSRPLVIHQERPPAPTLN